MAMVQDLITAMERIAPKEYAAPWDRVGLQVGSAERKLEGPVLLTIDLTERVLREAIAMRAGAVVAYHPPIWEPLGRVTDATPRQRIILRAIEAGIAIYTPHTALDAAPDGVTDWLCEGLSGGSEGRIAGDCRALEPHEALDSQQEVKLVTFVPREALEQVRSALATAGAGIIGNYQVCSFGLEGTGTFLGGEGSSPVVGEAGRLEEVREVRVEMVCSKAALPLAVETLREFHPYEEPPLDVYPLAPQPVRRAGMGRRLVLDQPATVAELCERVKSFLDRSRVRIALAGDEDVPVTHLGVVPGAGESMAPLARRVGCEVFITGEMRHHEVLASLHSGMSVLLAGHSNTERGYLLRLAGRLREMVSGVDVRVCDCDTDLLRVM